jgi:hypothetical protein
MIPIGASDLLKPEFYVVIPIGKAISGEMDRG